GERLPRLFFEIAVAGEDAWATGEYFAPAFRSADALFFFQGLNAQLNASDRFADAVERSLAGEIERQQRRSFGEPVPDGDLPAESLKFHRQFRIERRTTGGQQAQLRPELS